MICQGDSVEPQVFLSQRLEATRMQRNQTLHCFSLSAYFPQTVGEIGGIEISEEGRDLRAPRRHRS